MKGLTSWPSTLGAKEVFGMVVLLSASALLEVILQQDNRLVVAGQFVVLEKVDIFINK